MTSPAAIQGDYVDLKFIKSRKVCQIVVEVPIEAGPSVVQAFGTPLPDKNIPVALARLESQPEPAKKKRKMEEMQRSQQAGLLCTDRRFQTFMVERHDANIWMDAQDDIREQSCATAVRQLCNVNSRAQFDGPNEKAAAAWDTLYSEYQAWLKL